MAARSLARLAGGSVLCVVACACSQAAETEVPEERIALGAALYRSTCATCHGSEGQGKPRLGKELRGSPFVAELDDLELVAFLREGRRANHPLNTRRIDMPPRGGNPALGDEELLAIVAYLRSIG